MTDKPRLIIFASAATLALALAQPIRAEGEQAPATAPVAPAPAPAEAAAPAPAPAPASAPATAPADAAAHADARQRMETHMAEMTAERNRRYGELRQRATEVGIELPETPPWEQAMPEMPDMPQMPKLPDMPADMTGMKGMTGEEREAMRAARYEAMRERAKVHGIDLPETPPTKLMSPEERRAHWEKMHNLSTEERLAARAENYKQLRERAKAQGIDLPETPPWEQAQQRRKAMQEKWDAYRKQVDAMTEEQREAAKAVFGAGPMGGPAGGPGGEAPPMPMERPMPQMPQMRQMPMDMPQMPMDMPMPNPGPQGFGPGPCPQGDCGGMGMPPRGMMPGWGGNQGFDQAPPQGGYRQGPWTRGY